MEELYLEKGGYIKIDYESESNTDVKEWFQENNPSGIAKIEDYDDDYIKVENCPYYISLEYATRLQAYIRGYEPHDLLRLTTDAFYQVIDQELCEKAVSEVTEAELEFINIPTLEDEEVLEVVILATIIDLVKTED